MNENPEGTPNPLNPVQGVAPVGQEPAPETQPAELTEPKPAEEPASTSEQLADNQTPAVEQPIPAEQPLPEQPATTPVRPRPTVAARPMNTRGTTMDSFRRPAQAKQPATEATETAKSSNMETTSTGETIPTIETISVAEATSTVETGQATEHIRAVVPESPASSAVAPTMKIQPKAKNNKTGLLVAIILLVVAIVAGAAAALIMLNPFAKADAVPAAIMKLLNREMPKYASLNGTVNVSSNDRRFSSLSVGFDGGINNTNGESFVNAKVVAEFAAGGEFDFTASEIHTSDGDLFLRLSDIYQKLPLVSDQNSSTAEPRQFVFDDEEANCIGSGDMTNCATTKEIMEIDCIGGGEGTDACAPTEPISSEPTTSFISDGTILDYLGLFDVIEDEWVYIPSSSFSNITDITAINMPTQCLIDAADKLGQYGSEFVAKYKQNPFINYSTDNLGIVKRANNLYRLTFDADKMAGFINSLGNSGFMNELLACVGGVAVNTSINSSDLKQIFDYLPAIYVEIDDNDNFTRLYLSVASPDGFATATVDISISYPDSMTINKPSTYIDVNQALSEVLSEFYGHPIMDMNAVIEEDTSGDSIEAVVEEGTEEISE